MLIVVVTSKTHSSRQYVSRAFELQPNSFFYIFVQLLLNAVSFSIRFAIAIIPLDDSVSLDKLSENAFKCTWPIFDSRLHGSIFISKTFTKYFRRKKLFRRRRRRHCRRHRIDFVIMHAYTAFDDYKRFDAQIQFDIHIEDNIDVGLNSFS